MIQAQRSCATHFHNEQLMQSNPDFAQKRIEIENHTEKFLYGKPKKHRAIIKIPVVVHVIYNTAVQNISDAQINSQISVLNQDFRKLNADYTNIPSSFQTLGADCEIEFCLAQQTPSGTATTGIIRVPTAVTGFVDDNKMKFTAQGGDDAWDATKYLNIWVCKFNGSLLGYAQFPGGPAITDGVAIQYTAFGTVGTATAPFNKGRTATHEVGHWLNLFHIWGDDGTGCVGSDLVNDTPNQADENYGCPTFPQISCTNGPNGDLFMNYMDYTNDACMYMFTTGQKGRMTALFSTGGIRASLLTSIGCDPLVQFCGVPQTLSVSNITTSAANLQWLSVSNATSYQVQYKLVTSTIWTNVSTSTNSLNISGLVSGSAYEFQVQSVCASGTSAYSSAVNFNTINACSNNFEPNNTRLSALAIAANTTISSMLGSTTDKDYFLVSTTNNAPKLKVNLTNLPADYELKLYNATGTLLGSSLNTGLLSESITYNQASVGQAYTIYVFGYNGAYHASQCYSLNTQTSSVNLRPIDTIKNDEIAIKISPNPALDKISVQFEVVKEAEVNMCLYNSLGQKIGSQKTTCYEGYNNLSLDLSSYANGLYLLEITHGEYRFIERIMKK